MITTFFNRFFSNEKTENLPQTNFFGGTPKNTFTLGKYFSPNNIKYKNIKNFLFSTFLNSHNIENLNLGKYDPVRKATDKLSPSHKAKVIKHIVKEDLPSNHLNIDKGALRGYFEEKRERKTGFLPLSSLIYLNVLHNEIKYALKQKPVLGEQPPITSNEKKVLRKINKIVENELNTNTKVLNANIKHNTLKWEINHKKK